MSTWLTAGKRVLHVSLCAGVCVGGERCKNRHHPWYISAEMPCKASPMISRDIPIQPGLKAGLRVRNQSVKYSTNTFWSFVGGSGGLWHTPENVILTSVARVLPASAQHYPLTRAGRGTLILNDRLDCKCLLFNPELLGPLVRPWQTLAARQGKTLLPKLRRSSRDLCSLICDWSHFQH